MQRFLQVDDDLTAVGKHQGEHGAAALAIEIGIGIFIDAIAGRLHRSQQGFATVQELGIGHYNFAIMMYRQILVRGMALLATALALAGCGQRGPLHLPTDAAAAQRASLPQSLKNSLPGTNPASPPAPEKTAP